MDSCPRLAADVVHRPHFNDRMPLVITPAFMQIASEEEDSGNLEAEYEYLHHIKLKYVPQCSFICSSVCKVFHYIYLIHKSFVLNSVILIRCIYISAMKLKLTMLVSLVPSGRARKTLNVLYLNPSSTQLWTVVNRPQQRLFAVLAPVDIASEDQLSDNLEAEYEYLRHLQLHGFTERFVVHYCVGEALHEALHDIMFMRIRWLLWLIDYLSNTLRRASDQVKKAIYESYSFFSIYIVVHHSARLLLNVLGGSGPQCLMAAMI